MNKFFSFTFPYVIRSLRLDGDDGAGGGAGDDDPATKKANEALTNFEKWLELQPEDSRKQYGEQLNGLRDTVSKLRDENKKHKQSEKRLKELEDAEEARKKAAQTEADTLKEELQKANDAKDKAAKEKADALAELQKERLENKVTLIATGLNFVDPQDAIKLVDFAAAEFVKDDKPNETAIKKKLEDFAKEKPYLINKGDKTRGTPPPRNTGNGQNQNNNQNNNSNGNDERPLVKL